MFELSGNILLQGVRTSSLVDNATIHEESMDRGLEKLESIICMKNLLPIGILSNNLHDKVGDHSDNLKAIVEKADPTYTSIVINKHDVVAMAPNRGV